MRIIFYSWYVLLSSQANHNFKMGKKIYNRTNKQRKTPHQNEQVKNKELTTAQYHQQQQYNWYWQQFCEWNEEKGEFLWEMSNSRKRRMHAEQKREQVCFLRFRMNDGAMVKMKREKRVLTHTERREYQNSCLTFQLASMMSMFEYYMGAHKWMAKHIFYNDTGKKQRKT